MSVGFAVFSSRLTINSTANIASEWKVLISDVSIKEKSSAAKEISTPVIAANKTSISFNVGLEAPGDYLIYVITVKNEGTLNVLLYNVKAMYPDPASPIVFNVNYPVAAEPNHNWLEKNETHTIEVKVEYADVIEQPTVVDGTLLLELDYRQDLGDSTGIYTQPNWTYFPGIGLPPSTTG